MFDRARVLGSGKSAVAGVKIAATLSVGVATVRRVYEQGVAKPYVQETRSGDATKRVAGRLVASAETQMGLARCQKSSPP
jgi:hypothetical protein